MKGHPFHHGGPVRRLAGCACAFLVLAFSLPETRLGAQEEELPRAVATQPAGASEAPPARPVAEAPPRAARPVPQPGDDVYQYASYAFRGRHYDIALRHYLNFIRNYPKHPKADEGYYRSAECYRLLGVRDLAADQYLSHMKKHPGGDYIPHSAFRYAALKYEENAFKTAAPFFERAVKGFGIDTEVGAKAAYHQALCLARSGQTKASWTVYEQVADSKAVPNPFRDISLIELARGVYRAGEDALGRGSAKTAKELKEKSLGYFIRAAEGPSSADFKEEAYVKAGIVLQDLGRPEESIEYLRKSLDVQGSGEWKGIAKYFLVDHYYGQKEWGEVIDAYVGGGGVQPADGAAAYLLMVANAYRFQKNYPRAIKVYRNLEEGYPEEEESNEAGFYKLLCFHHLRDTGLPRLVDYYISQMEARGKGRSSLVNKARLFKAESYFEQGMLKLAAQEYRRIKLDELPEELQAPAALRGGWALADAEDNAGAVQALSAYITLNPEDEFVAQAIAKRASCYEKIPDFVSALDDYTTILEKFPDSPMAAIAQQRTAFIKAQQKDNEGMIEAFQVFLKRFPDSIAAEEAHYWIGQGLFDKKDYQGALKSLETALNITATDIYREKTHQYIVLSHRFLKDHEATAKAVEDYYAFNENAQVSKKVLTWVGGKYVEDENYQRAQKFLSLACTPDEPENTEAAVWYFLGICRSKLGLSAGTIEAMNHFIATNPPSLDRARGLLIRGKAYHSLGNLIHSRQDAMEALEAQEQGQINSRARILIGDIAMAEGNWDEAIEYYSEPARLVVDPSITPLALTKLAGAYENSGQAELAASTRQEVRQDYPKFVMDEVEIPIIRAKRIEENPPGGNVEDVALPAKPYVEKPDGDEDSEELEGEEIKPAGRPGNPEGEPGFE